MDNYKDPGAMKNIFVQIWWLEKMMPGNKGGNMCQTVCFVLVILINIIVVVLVILINIIIFFE